MAFDTFHPFPKLPFELRLIIWSFTCPGPRVVEVTRAARPFSDPTALFCPREGASKPCILLRVNKEARDVFLNPRHPLLPSQLRKGRGYNFWSSFHNPQKKHTLSPSGFLNPKIDTIYFNVESIDADDFDDDTPPTRGWLSALQKIGCLKELRYLACEDDVFYRLRDNDFPSRDR
jgi:hypothetical protein